MTIQHECRAYAHERVQLMFKRVVRPVTKQIVKITPTDTHNAYVDERQWEHTMVPGVFWELWPHGNSAVWGIDSPQGWIRASARPSVQRGPRNPGERT